MGIELLHSIDAFTDLSTLSTQKLLDIMKIKHVQSHSVIYYEGDLLESAYFLSKGRVELYKMEQNDNEVFLCYVVDNTQNRLINAFSSFTYYRASAGVRSIEESEILSFDLLKLKALVKSNADIANAFLKEYMNKAIVFKNIIDFNKVYDSTSRLAFILKTELERFNKTQRQVIAKELNMKIETLSRILQKMFQQGLIRKNERGDIILDNRDRFMELYGDVRLR